jgi:hypothetical protein
VAHQPSGNPLPSTGRNFPTWSRDSCCLHWSSRKGLGGELDNEVCPPSLKEAESRCVDTWICCYALLPCFCDEDKGVRLKEERVRGKKCRMYRMWEGAWNTYIHHSTLLVTYPRSARPNCLLRRTIGASISISLLISRCLPHYSLLPRPLTTLRLQALMEMEMEMYLEAPPTGLEVFCLTSHAPKRPSRRRTRTGCPSPCPCPRCS